MLRSLFPSSHLPAQVGVLLLILAPAVAIALGGWGGELRYERARALDGAWWLPFSGQFVHMNPAHTLLNAGAWVLIWTYARGCLSGKEWLAAILASLAAVAAGLLLFSPKITWYVGLSGMLHGMILAVACGALRRHDITGALILCVVMLKLSWEFHVGPTPGTARFAGGPVVVEAHRYGAVGGLLLFPFLWFGKKP